MWNFVFFTRRQITDACLFVFFFFVFFFSFSQGWSYRPSCPQNVARGLILTEMKSSSALFKWPKNWRAPRPPPTLIIFPKSVYIVMVIGKSTGVFRRIFWLGGGAEKRGRFWGNFLSRNLSWGKKISMKGAQDLLALFWKNQWKNK